ncbi:histidine--tRNA ligase [Candidatus Roizmanbacteria bacterium RIFCSPHIGHO2_12_FULL_33_9]|uniref:Histidine--tRNA ligase n=1 Tax=Candidatus Roizmanbacteria bacterium RIFCSPHIGHO2_12_FULL_33_9 TaxID=1802045 RepID=A0A1F7HG58_9BACT|nr:MAG: histidine--tRNA ligase [Candidatus Roizmanbacteria bacterium RIFCSPHIGHO2_12_FULL_33_9]
MTGLNPLKGFRDLYPQEKGVQSYLFEKMRQVANLLGYQEYDGPIVEPVGLYENKTSKELLERQTFQIKDKKGEILVLRPEMTPSLARMVANKAGQLIFPLKLYNIGARFRYEAPQKGRSREFYQADFDILGTKSIISDAESIYTLISIFEKLGATEKDFKVFINSRSYMEESLLNSNISKDKLSAILNIIDKKGKVEKNKFDAMLQDEKLSKEQILSIYRLIDKSTSGVDYPYFKELFSILKSYGVDKYCEINTSTVRGLDYYTGVVFEAIEVSNEEGSLNRSLFGGGRYDNLVSDFDQKLEIPGVGFATSDVILLKFMQNKGLIPNSVLKSPSCLITVFDDKTLYKSVELSAYLRKNNISCELYPDSQTKLDKQLKYADKRMIPYVLIIGPTEIKTNKIKVKDMKTGEQKDMRKEELIKKLETRSTKLETIL